MKVPSPHQLRAFLADSRQCWKHTVITATLYRDDFQQEDVDCCHREQRLSCFKINQIDLSLLSLWPPLLGKPCMAPTESVNCHCHWIDSMACFGKFHLPWHTGICQQLWHLNIPTTYTWPVSFYLMAFTLDTFLQCHCQGWGIGFSKTFVQVSRLL